MKLEEFLQNVDFVHGYGENPDVFLRVDGVLVEIEIVERAVGGKDEPIQVTAGAPVESDQK